jgi:hypothetical protein
MTMAANQDFQYDVFLSHSAKDKAVVRPRAEQLRQYGLRVSFDEWECPSPAGAGEGGRRSVEGRGAKAANTLVTYAHQFRKRGFPGPKGQRLGGAPLEEQLRIASFAENVVQRELL